MESFQIFIWKVYSRKFRLYRACILKEKGKAKWNEIFKNLYEFSTLEMGKQIKSSLLLTLLQEFYSFFSFHLPAIQRLISTRKKSCKHISHSPHVSVITRNILITIIRFARYHQLWLRYSSDLMKLEWTLLSFNFN